MQSVDVAYASSQTNTHNRALMQSVDVAYASSQTNTHNRALMQSVDLAPPKGPPTLKKRYRRRVERASLGFRV
jgi:hypothetical protein